MTRYFATPIAALCLAACSAAPEQDFEEQPFMSQQGTELPGVLPLGSQLQGMTRLQWFLFSGATRNGAPLVNFRLVKGELMAEQNSVTLQGTALNNTRLFAEWENSNVHPPQTVVVEYRINGIEAETNPSYDPTGTGSTYLYTIEQNVDNANNWQPACPVDSDGRRAAIPLADTWNATGHRNSAAPKFTLGCTTGAIAKCYRWGYRPWVTGHGNLTITHQTCTRLARADYCGDGESHTTNGRMINLWDSLTPPIRSQGMTPANMVFEAAWGQNGALCLSHARWEDDGEEATEDCPNKLRPPDHPNGNVCDDMAESLMHGNGPGRMFNESAIP